MNEQKNMSKDKCKRVYDSEQSSGWNNATKCQEHVSTFFTWYLLFKHVAIRYQIYQRLSNFDWKNEHQSRIALN